MSIDNKNLAKLINLCRKTGVLELEIDGIKLKLSHEAVLPKHRNLKSIQEPKVEGQLSEEDLLFWSSQGAG